MSAAHIGKNHEIPEDGQELWAKHVGTVINKQKHCAQQFGVKYYKLYLLVTLPLMKRFPETVCMLMVCWLYLSLNISIVFNVFSSVCSMEWYHSFGLYFRLSIIRDTTCSTYVIYINCIYKLRCTSKYSCMNVEFYALSDMKISSLWLWGVLSCWMWCW